MIRGLYTSAIGMTTQMNRMDVIANNIANVDTTGFKRDNAVTRAFSEELMKRLDDISDPRHDVGVGKVSQGLFVDDIYTDFSGGSLQRTDGTLDLAISGEGFFCVSALDVNGNEVEKYTRDGSFTLGADSVLMNKLGNKVLGISGAITLPSGPIDIHPNGDIYVNSEYVDSIRMTSFSDMHSLRKFKDSLYSTTEESEKIPFTGTLEQGFVEGSNANSVKEMVEMITTSRLYEANQRMVTIHDQVLSRTVNDLGRK